MNLQDIKDSAKTLAGHASMFWIPTTQSSPNKSDYYLVVISGHGLPYMKVDYFDVDRNIWACQLSNYPAHVLYYQYLPAFPGKLTDA